MEKKKYEISNRRTSPSFRLYRQASHVYSTCILNFFPIIRDFLAVIRTLSAFTEKSETNLEPKKNFSVEESQNNDLPA